jgi:hypothetical protein
VTVEASNPNHPAPVLQDRWLRETLADRLFLFLFSLGIAVRVILMILYFPAVMLWYDSPRYARIGGMPMFGDFWMPAGYPMLLRVLRCISEQMWFTIVVQHLFGLGTGTLLFLALRRLGAPRWAACVPAAVAFLSGDHLYLEHAVMADFLLTFLTTAGLTAAVFGLRQINETPWLGVASALLASAALARSVGVVLLPVLVLCTAFIARGPIRARAKKLSFALLPGLAVYALYIGACFASGGQYLGLSDMRGWNLYSRVAPFADCRKFTPPPETIQLCESRPAKKRPGPFGYVWDPASLARQKFALAPDAGEKLGKFAAQVIVHQPGAYLYAVLLDLARYVRPSIARNRPFAGQPADIISFGWRNAEVEENVVRPMSSSYRGTSVRLRGEHVLASYQALFRVGGFLLALCLLFTFLGFALARDEMRLGVFLFGLSALGLYILPVLTVSYDFRYGIPPETFIVVSGTLGAVAVRERIIQRRS